MAQISTTGRAACDAAIKHYQGLVQKCDNMTALSTEELMSYFVQSEALCKYAWDSWEKEMKNQREQEPKLEERWQLGSSTGSLCKDWMNMAQRAGELREEFMGMIGTRTYGS